MSDEHGAPVRSAAPLLLRSSAPSSLAPRPSPIATGDWRLATVLAAVTALALWLRLLWQWPLSRALQQAPYDDEGVYVMAAHLARQGIWPYRDYFFAHPPLGIASLLPAVAVGFTPWGSPQGFMQARLLMAVFGALTALLVGAAAARAWGGAGGAIAALLVGLDPASVANSRHVMLEVPMALLVAAALLAAQAERDRRWAGLASGLLAGLAAMVKLQALTLAAAWLAAAAWRRDWPSLRRLALGFLAATALLAPLALVAGPDRLLRQVVVFQVVRPPDGLTSLGERLALLLAPGGLLLGLVGAVAGIGMAAAAGPGRRWGVWAPVALWVGLSIAGFLASRSFYQHYASQLMPGLAFLAGGLGTAFRGGPALRRRLATGAAAALALGGVVAVGLPPVVQSKPDAIFTLVARYLADAAVLEEPVLTTDAQFNLLASRPLPRTTDGYLVDSYGQLVYAGLGLGEGPLWQAVPTAWRRGRTLSVYEAMWQPAAQALLREQVAWVNVVVIHAVGRSRLTPETAAWLKQDFRLAEANRRYDIYRRER